MKKWVLEGLNVFSVTTLFPLGWGMEKFKRLRKRPTSSALLMEHEHPILLVHGIFHNSTAFYELEKTLRKARFPHIHSMNLWTSVNHMEDLAAQLRGEALDLLKLAEEHRHFKEQPLKLRIAAHSLGGMITRVALLDAEFAKKVDKVLFLGTPHQGASLLQFPFPRCVGELKKGSPLIQRLKSEPLARGPRYYNIRGTLDIVTPLASTFLPHVLDLKFDEVGHAGLLNDRRVLQSIVEILESPFYDQPLEAVIG
jgi:triacylglycerol lipase